MLVRPWIIVLGLGVSSLPPLPFGVMAQDLAAFRSDSTGLYDSWLWTETFSGYHAGARVGTPSSCSCKRVLRLERGGSYQFVEQYRTQEYLLASGRFMIHRSHPGQRYFNYAMPIWVELTGWHDGLAAQYVRFAGPDTILLFPGSPDTLVSNSNYRRFTRGDLPRRGRPLQHRTSRSEFEAIPAEADSSYDTAPVPITKVAPQITQFAQEAGIDGDITLHVLVYPTGDVGSVTVLKGITGLNEAAIENARGWKFAPATRHRRPVSAWTTIVLAYRRDPNKPPIWRN